MATSGRGAGRNRPRSTAGPARSRPQSRRSGPARGGAAARGGGSRGGASRSGARGAAPGRASQAGSSQSRGQGRRPGGGKAGAGKGGRSGGTPSNPARRRPRLTGRSAVVIVVLAVLFVSYATSLRAFLEQRAHIDQLEAQVADDRAAIAELREEKRRWKDPAFIEARARERFGWVLPGEIGFRVIGEDGEPIEVGDSLTDPDQMGADPDAEWWSDTVASIRGAGAKPRTAGPDPADSIGPTRKRGVQAGGAARTAGSRHGGTQQRGTSHGGGRGR